MESKIEVVRLHRLENGGAIKAFADIQIGDDYVVKGFKVIEGKDGLFVGMPSEVGKSGKWFSTFEPLSDEAKMKIEEAIIEAYRA